MRYDAAMPAAVRTAFDVAFWFADRGLDENIYVQPLHLQRLMFLAQAHYAALHGGRALMPAAFVADELGPIEANVYATFADGRPRVVTDRFLPDPVVALLDWVWRRYAHQSADTLVRRINESPALTNARGRGPRALISLADMARTAEAWTAAMAKGPERVARNQSGKAVTVGRWQVKPAAGGGDGEA